MSHYQRLGVDATVDPETLRQAFRRRSKDLHPDTTQLPAEQAAREFQLLCESYDVLADPVQRRCYDEQCARSTPAVEPQQPFVSASWKGIGERRALSGGEWFALVLLGAALVLSLIVGLGLAALQGREWQVAPVWLTSVQTQTSANDVRDGRATDGRDPSESTFDSRS